MLLEVGFMVILGFTGIDCINFQRCCVCQWEKSRKGHIFIQYICTKYHTCNHLINNLVMAGENIVDSVKMKIDENEG